MYKRFWKRLIDILLSLAGLFLASWLYLLIMIAIEIDDPGPVFFSQKRVGIHKKYFQLYKFRSMKMSTPHDMPTHLLENPEQYITRVGKFLRKTSLDEIPQLWNILRGDMSVIGPRPALWNQEDLLAGRDKYGANDVKPGLSGWAQIRGRDVLERDLAGSRPAFAAASSVLPSALCAAKAWSRAARESCIRWRARNENSDRNQSFLYVLPLPQGTGGDVDAGA